MNRVQRAQQLEDLFQEYEQEIAEAQMLIRLDAPRSIILAEVPKLEQVLCSMKAQLEDNKRFFERYKPRGYEEELEASEDLRLHTDFFLSKLRKAY